MTTRLGRGPFFRPRRCRFVDRRSLARLALTLRTTRKKISRCVCFINIAASRSIQQTEIVFLFLPPNAQPARGAPSTYSLTRKAPPFGSRSSVNVPVPNASRAQLINLTEIPSQSNSRRLQNGTGGSLANSSFERRRPLVHATSLFRRIGERMRRTLRPGAGPN